jgi:hypothetical protein
VSRRRLGALAALAFNAAAIAALLRCCAKHSSPQSLRVAYLTG